MAISHDKVMDALRECYDPEVPINIVDLGLVYDVKVEGDQVHVKMTLTAPGCPAHAFISESVRRRLLRVEGVRDADVEMVWEPMWTPARITPAGRKQLGLA